MFPKDPNGFAIDDQFYVGGSGLLVKPVTSPNVKEAEVYLAENQVIHGFYRTFYVRNSNDAECRGIRCITTTSLTRLTGEPQKARQ